ncbi:Hypothetical predicted protein, partial [Paramuricea clavata]
ISKFVAVGSWQKHENKDRASQSPKKGQYSKIVFGKALNLNKHSSRPLNTRSLCAHRLDESEDENYNSEVSDGFSHEASSDSDYIPNDMDCTPNCGQGDRGRGRRSGRGRGLGRGRGRGCRS